MATAADSDAPSDDDPVCPVCDETFAPDDSPDPEGTYCSRRCYLTARGETLLTDLDRDHRICATCYTRIAEVQPPPFHAPENAIGYKYETPATATVIDDFSDDPHRRLEGTRWGCGRCGTVDHADRHGFLQAMDEAPTARRLYERLCELYDRGGIDAAPDHERFIAGWRAGGPALAAGRAVYGEDNA